MSIYMEEVTGEDREALIEEKRIDNELGKCFTMLEMLDLQYQQMCSDAEFKVLSEGGTYDDLAYLYAEAEAQVQQQQQGVISQIFEAIKGFFKGIFDFLFGTKDVPDTEVVQVPKGPMSVLSTIASGIHDSFDGLLSVFGIDVKNPVATIATITAAIAGGAAFGKIKQGWKDQTPEQQKFGVIKRAYLAVQNAISNLKSKPSADDQAAASDPKKKKGFLDAVKLVANFLNEHILAPIKAACEKVGKFVSDTAGKIKDKVTGGKGDANNATPPAGTLQQMSGGNVYRKDANNNITFMPKAEFDKNPNGTWTTINYSDINGANTIPEDVRNAFGVLISNGKVSVQSTPVSNSRTNLPGTQPDAQVQKLQNTATVVNNPGGNVAYIKDKLGSYRPVKDMNQVNGLIKVDNEERDGLPVYTYPNNNGQVVAASTDDIVSGPSLFESVDLLDVNAVIGDNYLLEFVDDDTLYIEFIGDNPEDDFLGQFTEAYRKEAEALAASDLEDDDTITTESSIFGTQINEDEIEYEGFKDNEELKELAALFETV